MKKLVNLEKVVAELNAPVTYDGETYESSFDFQIRTGKNYDKEYVDVYDANEAYYADYAYDAYVESRMLAKEFGFKMPTSWDDNIRNKLNDAIKKDLGDDCYFEWEDYVVSRAYCQ